MLSLLSIFLLRGFAALSYSRKCPLPPPSPPAGLTTLERDGLRNIGGAAGAKTQQVYSQRHCSNLQCERVCVRDKLVHACACARERETRPWVKTGFGGKGLVLGVKA